jgi:hypothetical protein
MINRTKEKEQMKTQARSIRARSTMRGTLLDRLTETLDETITTWLCEEEGGNWPVQDFPFTGRNTTRIMAEAALAVLNGIYDAEMELVAEGCIDATKALLPEQKA